MYVCMYPQMVKIIDAKVLLRQGVAALPRVQIARHTKTKQMIGNIAAAYADSDLVLSAYHWALHDVCSLVGRVWYLYLPNLFLVLSTFLFPVSYDYF